MENFTNLQIYVGGGLAIVTFIVTVIAVNIYRVWGFFGAAILTAGFYFWLSCSPVFQPVAPWPVYFFILGLVIYAAGVAAFNSR